jgi:molecular chaperone DnaK
MIHMTEKTLGELGDKVDAETRANVEREIEKLKKAKDGDDLDAVKSATETLTQASHKLAELMYAQASQNQGGAAGADAAGKASSGKDDDDDVVDADFEEVK